MRARALRPLRKSGNRLRSRALRVDSPAALVFLRGRDADARLREIAGTRTVARPVLGALAAELLRRKLPEALGYRSLGDFSRERLGVGARTVREWARVSDGLRDLPELRAAILGGEVSWAVARLVVGLATPETETACLAAVRGRTVRAVRAIVAAVRAVQAASPGSSATPGPEIGDADPEDDEDRVLVRLGCSAREALLWEVAVELARRVAGEELPVWECADRVAAEAASAIGAVMGSGGSDRGECDALEAAGTTQTGSAVEPAGEPGEGTEAGLRSEAFPTLAWSPVAGSLPGRIAALARDLAGCGPREIERRLRAAVAFLQTADLATGRLLRRVVDRGLYRELGFESLARYVEERLDLAPRTARSLVSLARGAGRAPAVADAFRAGRLNALQAHAISRALRADGSNGATDARDWVERARRVTLRRLEEDVGALPRGEIAFRAPEPVARFFLAMVSRAGSLERLLAHAIATWTQLGEQFEDYADFERDGYRCTVPGCTGRRELHSHHIRFRSAQGPDEAWNRTTLCAFHHQHCVHGAGSPKGRAVRIRGRAPGALVFELGPEPAERFASGDLRLPLRSR